MDPHSEGTYVSILSDTKIKRRCDHARPMIAPFYPTQVTRDEQEKKIISFGLSSYGYDVRLSNEFLIPDNDTLNVYENDPHNPPPMQKVFRNSPLIAPGGFILGRTIEYMTIPRDILTLCIGKSTYARCGILVNVTPLEPEWEGYVTLEISNVTKEPARVYAFEGICQFIFFEAANICDVSYADRKGKYQKQLYVTPAKV